MKIDLHCHTSEGSQDSLVNLKTTVDLLISQGYNGMVITDHNSYEGCKKILTLNVKNFVILKGVEYDTSDAGHMIIILPKDKDSKVFTHKGMKIKDVIKIVHSLGGVIGPAHPFDYFKLGILNNTKWIQNQSIIKNFDFIETFNACGSKLGNHKADLLAKYFDLPTMGGSDSHRKISVGKGWTELTEYVTNETEFVNLIKRSNYKDFKVGGEIFQGTSREKHKKMYAIGIRLFCIFISVTSPFSRRKALKLAAIAK